MIDKRKIQNDFIEIIGMNLHAIDLDRRGDFDASRLGEWRDRYLGIHDHDLPYQVVFFNSFKPRVDSIVADLMHALQNAENDIT